jgi:hypothetical protein
MQFFPFASNHLNAEFSHYMNEINRSVKKEFIFINMLGDGGGEGKRGCCVDSLRNPAI